MEITLETSERVTGVKSVRKIEDFARDARFFFRLMREHKPIGVYKEIMRPIEMKSHYEEFRSENEDYFQQQLKNHAFCYKLNKENELTV